MPISEQTQVAAAEGVASSTQQVEHVTTVGPWSLRRGSSSSWTAISSPGVRSRSRRGTVISIIETPSVRRDAAAAASDSNPFNDAFAASLASNNPFRCRNTSEASSSTAVESGGGMDVADARLEKSEFAKTMEEADRQCEAAQHILDGITIMESNTDAERWRYDLAREERSPRGGRWTGLRWTAAAIDRPLHHLPGRSTLATTDIEREAADALHVMAAQPDGCQACTQNATFAKASLCILGFSLLLMAVSPFVFYGVLHDEIGAFNHLLREHHRMKLWVALGAVPWMAHCSLAIVANQAFVSVLKPPVRRVSGARIFTSWLVMTGVAMGVYLFFGFILLVVYKLGD